MSKLKAKDPKTAEPSKPKILVFGKPGVGKTWASLDFPRVYYIDTEGGADLGHYTDKLKASGGAYLGPSDGSLDFDVVLEQFEALATESHGFKTVVVDSISKLYNTAIAAEAARLGDKDAFGASKKPAIANMRQLIKWTDRIDMNVIFIAHEKPVWGKDPKTGEQGQVGVTFDAWDKLEYELHLAMQITKQGSSRYAKVTKSRLEGFPDAESIPWSYTEFANRYGRDVIEGEVKAISLADPVKVQELERLVSVLKIDEDTVEKWLTKANASKLSDMTDEQVSKTIQHLKKQLN